MEKTEKPDINIREYSGSLYLGDKKKWIYGTLALKSDVIIFDSENKILIIPYDNLKDVKKATTGLVFGAIVVSTKTDKHWLSSFEDRESVYNALCHFWSSKLFRKEGRNGAAFSCESQTKMGKKLIGILQDSEKTLTNAANKLQHQGHQIDLAIATMDDFQQDLDIADNLVTGLEKWLGPWKLPAEYTKVDPVIVSRADIPDVFEYEVLHTRLETGKVNTQNLGLLRIAKEGIILLTSKQKVVQYLKWGDVSKIRVVSPWEIMIIKYNIGLADLVYAVVSSDMVAILKVLDKCAKYKLEYETPPDTVFCVRNTISTRSRHHKDAHKDLFAQDYPSKIDDSHDARGGLVEKNSMTSGQQPVIQQSARYEVVSDEEVAEISRTLENLKGLALSVQQEEVCQNENLDKLTTKVDRANDRISAANRRMKALT
ncbi:hypothetical protein CHS0354_007980 [Potamilus streckersoni]|uniref:Synaptosomal-associated protein 47 n=1 Tax=Potamilus streckersoni TaxID=2493646 RepID=A0AAE0SBZ5_9BIVA|nr:hypothetical protein CHS0354_007980 [Potamilus streckersoni]